MAFEDLNINNSEWEVYHNSEGMLVPIMDEYPSPENTFDVWSSNEGATTTTNTNEKLDPEAIAGLVTTVATVGSQLVANRDETKRDLKNRCGRRPLLRKNRAEYDRCKEEFYKEMQGGGSFKSTMPQQPIVVAPPPPQGMSTTAKIGIALGIVALGVGGYFLWKRSKK
jgi:hypothetical protein